MLDRTAAAAEARVSTPESTVVATVRAVASRELAPLVERIDGEGLYPEAAMRAFGRAGAFAAHLPGAQAPDLATAIQAMAAAGEHCLSTAFCMWCQDALGWYIFASENDALKRTLGARVAAGEALGGTALSNPMKSFFGIEPLRLKGTRADGGYLVQGLLPYVSNLGPDHYFGAVFEAQDEPKRNVMCVIPCASAGVTLADNTRFTALDGTRTFSVQLRDVHVPDAFVLADPCPDYIRRIRAGFVLLQAGMALGRIRDCVAMMTALQDRLGHVNRYLDLQPEPLAGQLAVLEATVTRLAATPFETDRDYWRAVIEARLAASETSLAAAQAAMLHCGARGYVRNAAAQRRLREAYFVAIVTPAIKQLRKMLADMAH